MEEQRHREERRWGGEKERRVWIGGGGEDVSVRTAWLRAGKQWHPKLIAALVGLSALPPTSSLCLCVSVVNASHANRRNAHKQGNNEGDRGV